MTQAKSTTGTLKVVMPKLGLTMTEATLVAWHYDDGDAVSAGTPLFTLETEKASLEIEAPAGGVLHIVTPEGETVPVQHVIATIAATGDVMNTQTQGSAPGGAPAASPGAVRASPRARALAAAEGISLAGMTGSGPRKMVVARDVAARVAAQAQAVPATPEPAASPVARRLAAQLGIALQEVAGTGPQGRIMRADVEAAARPQGRPADEPRPQQERPPEPLSGLRAVIAERLSEGWRERPQVTIVSELDATALVSARAQVNAEFEERISYNAFLIKAVATALVAHPEFNVYLTPDGLVALASIDVGLAIDTPRGLLVPIVRQADEKGLWEVQRDIADLARRAIEGTLTPSELEGGSFTVTNLGMYEVEIFTPIINPPQSAILGVGTIVQKPVVIDGAVEVQDRMTLSLAFDHRVADGAPAARFLQRIKRLLERPIVLTMA